MSGADGNRYGSTDLDPSTRLAGIGLSDAGRHPIARDRTEVGIRPFPFPFVAGLALADPATEVAGPSFEDARAFINGNASTPYGQGLGLEVGASLRIGNGRACLSGRPLELARSGWLDALSFEGATDGAMGPELPSFLEELDRREIGTKVLLPDGHRPSGEALASLGRADIHYRAAPDLLERDRFGDHLDHRNVGALQDAIRRYDWEQWCAHAPAEAGRRRLPPIVDHTLRRMRDILQTGRGRHADRWTALLGGEGTSSGRDLERDRLVRLFNRVLQDEWSPGAPRLFKRYRGALTPSLTTFPAQVRSSQLDALEAGGGAVVVDVRLGLWTLIGRASAQDSSRPVGMPALDQHAVSAFRDLASRRDAGRLLVATTGRLLDLLARREDLRFRVQRSRTRWTITLETLAGPSGPRPITDADLNGLALLVPASAPEVVVGVNGRADPLELTREPDPSHRGLHALHAAWRPLEWPSA